MRRGAEVNTPPRAWTRLRMEVMPIPLTYGWLRPTPSSATRRTSSPESRVTVTSQCVAWAWRTTLFSASSTTR